MVNPVHTLEFSMRIADPVHGLIRLTDIEAKVLQHPIFQRLRRITQLGLAKYVYPGAMHNRFSHSLGVLHNTTKIFEISYRNWIRDPHLCGEINDDYLFSEFVLQVTRLAAMCHDLGHFPFSHNMEGAIDWLHKSGLIPQSFRHEKLSGIIIKELLGDILGEYTKPVAAVIEGELSSLNGCLFPSFVVSSAIDADRMDYLIRDSHHCGVDQGRFDRERLLDTILPYATTISNKTYDVMAFRSKGIEAIEQFLLARHRMHQTIYFNPSVVGFEAGLRRAYYMITTDNPPWELPVVYLEEPSKFIEFDEAEFFVKLKRELRKRDSWLQSPILKRKPLQKMGPFYYTLVDNAEPNHKDRESFSLLKRKKQELEKPENDWYQKDHWVYSEHKTQVLVDSLPEKSNTNYVNFDDVSTLKNVIFLINANGDVIDPTDASYGHTFLPFITGHTYHRFLFFTHKKNKTRIYKELQPLINRFEEYLVRELPKSDNLRNQ